MFKKITIENFRGIESLEIDDFKQVNLFVGANNSGKTSVLEALQTSFNRNAFEQLIFLNNNARYYGLQLNNLETFFEKTEAINKHFKSVFYQNLILDEKLEPVYLKLTGSFLDQKEETVNLFSTKALNKWYSKLSIGSTDHQSIISLPSLKEKAPEVNISEWLQENTRNNSFFFENSLIYSGMAVIQLLYKKVIENKLEAQLVSLLQEVDPVIQDVQFDGQVFYVDIKSGEKDYRIDGRLMGEGIKKIFILALVILSQNVQDGILLIDEIENGLHYSSQQKLWNWLFKIAKEKNIQIFATTHSMDCVKAFVEAGKKEYGEGADNERLYRLVKKGNDEIKARKYDGEVLEGWLSEPWELR